MLKMFSDDTEGLIPSEIQCSFSKYMNHVPYLFGCELGFLVQVQ